MAAVVACAALMAGWLAPAVLAQDLSPAEPYKLADGPHEVRTVPELLLHDAERGKDMAVLVRYPKDGGPYPVILFPAGASGQKEAYDRPSLYWASHGYVCIHHDAVTTRTDPEVWRERVEDGKFVLDSLGEIQRLAPHLAGKIDETRIGASAHSLGAYITMLLGGTTVDWEGEPERQSLRDERIDAVVLLSPQGALQQGLTRHSWDDFVIPEMVVTGTRDRGATGGKLDWKLHPYTFAASEHKYALILEEAHHGLGGFQSLSNRFPETEWQIDAIKMATIAFWDAHLKELPEARVFLESDRIEALSRQRASLASHEALLEANQGVGRERRSRLIERFDTNGDGELDEQETKALREALQRRRSGGAS
jgi:predicted dienelactone hydrolase